MVIPAMSNTHPLVGVILAAGASERMGRPKQLLPYGRSTLLNSTIKVFQESQLERIVVVVGSSGDVVRASIHADDVTIVDNPDWETGNVSSLRTGVAAAPDARAIILAAGDLPELRPEAVNTLLDRWKADAPWACVANYDDRIAHPFLLSREAIDEAVGDGQPHLLWRTLVESGDDRVVRVAFGGMAPRDINTPEDYRALTSSGGD